MSACADQELLLGGLIDGELDAANTALVEAHVARCEGCREELERLQAIHNLLGTDGVRHSAPEKLRQRIAELPEQPANVGGRHILPGWLAPGLAGALAASLAALQRAETAPAPELMAEDLRLAARELGRIAGRIEVEDLLDAIFRDFCIGK